ncbi:hypothetical protein FNU76_19895 [Chitinimonas arctica]|uniref:Uncharacterized protein n=1 Tax=Chitinimonas arctica TaxID=2594795 RepID=A0A516SJW0_9NEIS|nr:hypothetical protein [Chitinimonas arctica]QDQ28437.1 hypothetical protein FNU76_19895 [Chitinimonas arctica]
MFFSKRKPPVCVTKLYFDCPLGEEVDFSVVKSALGELAEPAVRYAINFAQFQPMSTLHSSNAQMKYEDLEDLDIVGQDGKSILSLGRAGKAFRADTLYECVLVDSQVDTGASKNLFERLLSLFDVKYGYSRFLGGDFLPATEEKMKTGLFSSVSIRVGMVEDAWMVSPGEMDSGAIKGLYPINFWNKKAETKIKEIGLILPESCGELSGVVAFSAQEQKQIIASNSKKFGRHIHFGTD